MTRDANQIAQEAARQEEARLRTRGRPVEGPHRGTLTVWEQLSDMKRGLPPLEKFLDVTVNVGTSNQIVMTNEEGSRYLYYPRPGTYVEFVPHAGE